MPGQRAMAAVLDSVDEAIGHDRIETDMLKADALLIGLVKLKWRSKN